MYPSIEIVSAAASYPVTVAEIKKQAAIDHSEDDDYITSLLAAATEYVEQATGRALITRTLDVRYTGWPCGDRLILPVPPCQSVTHVKYTDSTESESTWASTNYIVAHDFTAPVLSPYPRNAEIVLKWSYSWPSATLSPSWPIVARIVAGYGSASAVPEPFKHAIKMVVAHWYEHREAVIIGSAAAVDSKAVAMGVDALLANFRVHQ